MTIRKKTMFISGLVLSLLLVLALAGTWLFLFRKVLEQEKVLAAQNQDRFASVIKTQSAEFEKEILSLISWDIKSLSPAFFNNMTPATAAAYGFDSMVLLGQEGYPLGTRFFDRKQKREIKTQENIFPISEYFKSIAALKNRFEMATVVSSGSGIYLAVIIHEAAGAAGEKFSFVFLKEMTPEFLLETARRVSINATAIPFASTAMPHDFAAVKSANSFPALVRHNSEKIYSYSRIDDMRGQPVFLVRIAMERRFYKSFLSALTYFSIFTVLSSILSVILLVSFLNKEIFSRLEKIGEFLRQFQPKLSLPPPITMHGEDEISMLADAINGMSQTIRKDYTCLLDNENELRKEKERAEMLYRIVPNAVFTVDKNHRITSWNAAAEELTGYSAEEALGKECTFCAETVCPHLCALLAKDSAHSHRGTITIKRKDGTMRTITKDAALLVRADGTIDGTIESFNDITELVKAEEALKESESRLLAIVEATFEGAVIIENYHIINTNKQYADITGYTVEELLGKNVMEMIADEEHEKVRQHIAENYQQPYLIIGLTKDGKRRYQEVRGKAAILNGRKVRMTSVRDVTDEINKEREIQDHNAFLAVLAAIRGSRDVDTELSMRQSFLSSLAQNFGVSMAIYGETRNGILCLTQSASISGGKDEMVRISAEEASSSLQAVQKVLTESKPFLHHYPSQAGHFKAAFVMPLIIGTVPEGGIILYSEDPATFSEGRLFQLFLLSNEMGTIIQEKRRRETTEAEVRAVSARNKALIDAIPDLIFVVGRDCIIRDYKSSAHHELYANPEQFLHKKPSLLFPSPLGQAFEDIIERSFHEKTSQTIEYVLPMHGAEAYYEARLFPYSDQEALILVRNITDWKQLQDDLKKSKLAAEASSMAKTQFLANMSHEIRTPMNAIVGFANLLSQTELDDLQKDYAATIIQSGQVLLSLVEDILDISKIEAGGIEIESTEFNLENLIEETLSIVKPKIKQDVELIFSYNTPINIVKGDPTRTRQIILNLLSNAAKFTHKGEIELTVESREVNPAMSLAIISVRDTGIGVPEDKHESIFEPFSQADSSTTRKYGGTGLGLAISKKIAMLMGGSLVLESEQGKGSEFKLYIPLHFNPVSNSLVLPEEIKQALRGKRAAIFEPNEHVRQSLAGILRRAGMETLFASSETEEFLRAVTAEKPDFVFCSPSPDHINCGQALSAASPATKAISLLKEAPHIHSGGIRHSQYILKPASLRSVLRACLPESHRSGTRDDDHAGRKTLSGKTILIVEDNEINRKLMQVLFSQWNCEADFAVNGRDAIDKTRGRKYDLILMDLQMPVMNGYEATKIIKEDVDADVPIIALTAVAFTEEKDRALQAGMSDFITKPVQIQQLKEKILKWLPD